MASLRWRLRARPGWRRGSDGATPAGYPDGWLRKIKRGG
ncbi:hypothetical protein [Azospirillum largimobile]